MLRFCFDDRYSTFWVLYPVGVAAELWTTTSALKEAYAWNPIYAGFMAAVMVGYIPGMIVFI
jgi:Protein tyrosine phosphatase-like protein, PTPLA